MVKRRNTPTSEPILTPERGAEAAPESARRRKIEGTAAPLVPPEPTLPKLREASRHCRACPIGEHATQTVFGEGIAGARLMLIGEQPGDMEDRRGHPFVGPSGRLLDRALEEVGLDRSLVYVTNAVKHFKWEPRGKRRIHKTPLVGEIAACHPWLEAEIAVVRPEAIVCLGRIAAQAILGKAVRVTERRGEIIRSCPSAPLVMVTVHPSAVLRSPDEDTRLIETGRFIDDLAVIARELARLERGAHSV